MGGAAVSLLAEARAAGLEVRADDGRLVVRGPRSRAELAERLLARTGEVLALLAAEDAAVAWRVAAMRPRVSAGGRSRSWLRGKRSRRPGSAPRTATRWARGGASAAGRARGQRGWCCTRSGRELRSERE